MNKFYWHEVRQVNVHDIPGIRYLPCAPVMGASHAVTRIENGTFIRYLRDVQGGPSNDDTVWIFHLVDKPEIEVLIPGSAIPYLWKAKQRTVRR